MQSSTATVQANNPEPWSQLEAHLRSLRRTFVARQFAHHGLTRLGFLQLRKVYEEYKDKAWAAANPTYHAVLQYLYSRANEVVNTCIQVPLKLRCKDNPERKKKALEKLLRSVNTLASTLGLVHRERGGRERCHHCLWHCCPACGIPRPCLIRIVLPRSARIAETSPYMRSLLKGLGEKDEDEVLARLGQAASCFEKWHKDHKDHKDQPLLRVRQKNCPRRQLAVGFSPRWKRSYQLQGFLGSSPAARSLE